MKRLNRLSALMVLAGLIAMGIVAGVNAAPDLSAERKMKNAWRLAQRSGVYHLMDVQI